ncbi:MAG: 16S rRNA (uracil(1498)-N(3))-methyltransferase [Victivallaceae bacterium]|nr:16S rRNA (uracil(1498)-N(3))-methyltransferase [Victivallaceae bacterium]
MNLLLLEEKDFLSDGTARISDRRCRQLHDVIRATPGKLCKAGILGGKCGTAEILAIDETQCRLVFTAEKEPPAPAPLVLIAALPRPQTLVKVLHCAASNGIKKICFIHTFKVEKSYWSSPRLAPETIREELLLALEQAGDTLLPEVKFFRAFRPFVEEHLEEIASGKRLLGDPAGEAASFAENATLAVGPEGGFTDAEKRAFREHGFTEVSLGKRTLRTEFALQGLISRIVR